MKKDKEKELLGLVKKNYSEIAADFDRTRKKRLWPELLKLSSNIKDGAKILDAGCGNGRLIEAFLQKHVSYFGFDNSAELISLAKKNYPAYEFVVDDILEQKTVKENFFDIIFCIAVIPHLPGKENRVKALRLLSSKLNSGGKLIISFWDLRSNAKYRRQIFSASLKKFFGFNKLDYGDLLFDWQGKEKSRRYYHAFTEPEIISLIKESNLLVEKLYRADNNFWLIAKKK